MQTRMTDVMDIEGIDIHNIQHVEVLLDDTNKLWINVQDKCLLRIGQVDTLTIDTRKFKGEIRNTDK